MSTSFRNLVEDIAQNSVFTTGNREGKAKNLLNTKSCFILSKGNIRLRRIMREKQIHIKKEQQYKKQPENQTYIVFLDTAAKAMN